MGVAIATLIQLKLQASDGITLAAVASAGSAANLDMLDRSEADFAILQGLFGAFARDGSGPLAPGGPRRAIRSIAGVWPNVEHFLVHRVDVATGTVADFAAQRGRKVTLGLRNSGSLVSSTALLSSLGVDPAAAFDLVYLGFDEAAEAFISGGIAAVEIPGGAPVPAITRIYEAVPDLAVLTFTDGEVLAVDRRFPDLWTRWVVAPGTYPNQPDPIATVSQPNFLAVRAEIPDDTVELITRTIFENLSFLRALHPAARAMHLETALDGLPLPLHPGALRYYDAVGIAVPDRLRS